MRKSIIMLVISAALAISAFAGTASASSAQSGSFADGQYTVVFNHGNNPGDTCTNDLYFYDGVYYTFVGHYVGFETFVSNSNGMTLQCHLSLAYGPGVANTLNLRFDGLKQVYNPAGNSLFSQHV